MAYTPGVHLYVPSKGAQCIMLHEAKDPEFGFGTAFGDIQRISVSDMYANGLSLILESIRQAPGRMKSEPAEIEKLSKKEQKEIDRTHKLLSISLSAVNQEQFLRIAAMKYQAGRHKDTKKPVLLRMPATQEEFNKGIQSALEQLN